MKAKNKDDKVQPEDFKPIVFVNNPIKEPKEDIVGFESQVETLECAIDKGASLIGVIADYGTGKSSLTDVLSVRLYESKKIVKPIKINLWDCLENNKNVNNAEKVSLLTRSFLYQLSNGYGQKFGNFINKILSKNYGNISFGVNSTRFWALLILAGASFVAYKISTATNTGIMQYLPEIFDVIASYVKLFSPMFLFLSCLFLILGLKDTYVAYSHWKMEGKRDLEINDVFDTYSTVIIKIKPFRKNKKRLIIVEDLDRVVEETVIVDFLKELYRFQDSLGKYSDRFVFIISIKPESLLKKSKNNDDDKIYSKIFDIVISLKPIHFDDYDSVLLKLINSNPEQKKELERLINAKIDITLPESFKWIKKGENLTLRDLKDRLNHAISIMLSIKNKNYKVSTSAEFEACTAIAYFESHYPKDYYTLIRNETCFADFMRSAMSIVNLTSVERQSELVKLFNNIFKVPNSTAYTVDFIKELCGLVAEGIFNDDFRMYFYTYPKGSPIKTTDERELCNYLLFPNIYKNHENLDDVVSRVLKNDENSIIENTLKSLEKFPVVILENTALFVFATKISIEKSFSTFSEEIIESDYNEEYKSEIWERLMSLDRLYYEIYVKKSIGKILSAFKDPNAIIKIRKSIIMGLKSDVVHFERLYQSSDNRIPLITKDEIQLIDDISISLKFIQSNILTKDSFTYIAKAINDESISKNSEAFKLACETFNRFAEILSPKELGKQLFLFLDINEYLDDSFFKIVSAADVDLRIVAKYLNKFSVEDFSDEYIRIINRLGFDDYISDELVDRTLENGYCYTALLFYSKKNNFIKLNPYMDEASLFVDVCKEINEKLPNVVCNFRKYAIEYNQPEYKTLYFSPFPMISEKEYISLSSNSESIKMIDTMQINKENCNEIMNMICKKKYSSDEIVLILDWLFNDDENENSLSEPVLRKKAVEDLDFSKLNLRELNDEQRDYVYDLISDVFTVKTSSDSINVMNKLNCLIPCLEKLAQNDNIKYLSLVADFGEVTVETLKWFDENYISCAMPKNICEILYERKDYSNYIIADVLRRQDMIIDDSIPFADYISVYKNVSEMFEIMSNHYDFLERLQLEADFDELSDEHLMPAFKVPQHERFFNYIFSEKKSEKLKKAYLSEFGKFATLDDSMAFQRLMCKEENMNLLGSEKTFSKIHRHLWELNRGHKGVFTRKWNERWKDII